MIWPKFPPTKRTQGSKREPDPGAPNPCILAVVAVVVVVAVVAVVAVVSVVTVVAVVREVAGAVHVCCLSV